MKKLKLVSYILFFIITNIFAYSPDLSFVKLLSENCEWHFMGQNLMFQYDSSCTDCHVPFVNISGENITDNEYLSHTKKPEFLLFRQIPLFIDDTKHVTIALETFFKHGTDCWFVVKFLNAKEQTVCSDSIEIKKSTEMHPIKIRSHVGEIKFLYLEIRCKGDIEFENTQKLDISLGDLLIKIDEQDYEGYQSETKSGSLGHGFFNQLDIEPFTDSISFAVLDPYFSNNKIIALGETIHGSYEFTNTAFQIIKTLVETKEYDLVFLELPISELLIYNAYINDESEMDIDSLVKSHRSLLDPSSFVCLLTYLRDYNRSNDHEITLVGVDKKSRSEIKYDLFSFAQKMLDKGNVADTLLFKLGIMDFNGAIEYIRQNEPYFLAQLGKRNQALLLQCLQPYKDPDKCNTSTLMVKVNDLYRRDEWMWENAQFAINNFCRPGKKVVIYCHYAHVNKVNTQFFPFHRSLGYYLEKQFGNTYHVCALIAGEGSRTAFNNSEMSNQSYLQDAFDGSLEKECSKTGHKSFIASLDNIFNPIWMRYGGNQVLNIFEYWGTKNRMDSFIYIDKVSGFDIPPEWMAKNFDTSLKNKENELKRELLRIWRE